MTQKQIIGAGLAGLITACRINDTYIYESGPRAESHKALLRFRDKSVSQLTGIAFQEVVVHKEISYNGEARHQCTIAMANEYARKVSGFIRGRSIWDLDTVKRYVAPEDFYDQLCDKHGKRILWSNKDWHINATAMQTISTIPLPTMMKICDMEPQQFDFPSSQIHVDRYRIEGAKVYQTVYFPAPDLRVFRASITGDLLIVESMKGDPVDAFAWQFSAESELYAVTDAFGLGVDDVERLDTADQRYGKIVEMPKLQREAILYELTHRFNVLSIGRFATWRNILLDDVVKDIGVVEKLMNASTYGRGLVLANR